MTEQNSINFNSDDFTITSGALEANDATAKSAATDGSAATPSAHVLTVAGSGSIVTSGAGSTVTVDGSGITSDFVFISSTTASNDTSVDFTDLSSSYIMYKIVLLDVIPATNGAELVVRTSTNNGGAYDTSGYGYNMVEVVAGDSFGDKNSKTATEMWIGNNCQSGQTTNGLIDLYNPAGTAFTHITTLVSSSEETGDHQLCISQGVRLSAADVDAVRIMFNAGNITSGVIKLYGIVPS